MPVAAPNATWSVNIKDKNEYPKTCIKQEECLLLEPILFFVKNKECKM